MIPPIDLSAASRQVAALLDEFGHGDVRYMVQGTLWNHLRGFEDFSVSIYVGTDRPFRLEAGTLEETLAKVRAELVSRFGGG